MPLSHDIHVVEGESHKVSFMFDSDEAEAGRMLIQPPVHFSEELLQWAAEDGGYQSIEEFTSSTYGALFWTESKLDIDGKPDVMDKRVSMAKQGAQMLLKYADSTNNLNILNEGKKKEV